MDSEPRKLVLILGNGFDLDLGLKTSYKDFWGSEFCPKNYPAPLIHYLNKCWPDNLDAVRWYDLENEFLNYYKRINESKPYPDVIDAYEKRFINEVNPTYIGYGIEDKYFNAARSLIEKGYLVQNPNLSTYSMPYRDDLKETTIWRDNKAVRLIKQRLCDYINALDTGRFESNSMALQVLFAVECARADHNYVSIYNFNYTPLPVDYGDGFMDCVHYVHGKGRDGKIIVGTRDDAGIDKSYCFLQKSFDPFFAPPGIVSDLLDADDIIFFGHSIGENDMQYFKAFFKQQTDNAHTVKKNITVFTLDDKSEIDIKYSLNRMTDGNLSTLYSLNHFQIIKTSKDNASLETLKTFLGRLITDEKQLRSTLNKVSER